MPDLPIGHPDFGKAVACSCRDHERALRRRRAVERLSGQDAVQNLTFERFLPEGNGLAPDRAANLRRAFEACQRYAAEPDGWLLLTGTFGCGKTHLAAAIVNQRIAEGKAALFLTVADLLDHLRSAFAPSSELPYDALFEQLRAAPLLVLDDFGAQSSTPWAQEKLFQLLNHRYNLRTPTVITTNQRFEEMEPRLRSRLQDIDLVERVSILAPDFRTGAAQGPGDLSSLGLHREQRFDTFDLRRADLSSDERSGLQRVYDECRSFAEGPHGWLVLAGTYGCGKTHLAAAIANEQVDRARSDVMFVVTPDLLDYLRASFGPNSSTSYDRRFDEIKRTPILILDDLGTESATPWAREKLFQLLNYRYDAALPTVITTSRPTNEIDPWLKTRMADVARCRFCAIQAAGYRGSSSQQQNFRPTETRPPRRYK
jgi:DNA replication protein DnaC